MLYRSSHPEMLNFGKIHRRTTVLESLFNKSAGLLAVALLKKKIEHGGFPVNFAKILTAPFFYGTIPVAASV